LAGYLVALTPQAPVVAAVITGLLGLILGGSVVFIRNSEEKYSFAFWAFGAVVFCLVFYLIHDYRRNAVIEASNAALLDELFTKQKIQQEHVQECSRFEFKINQERKVANLEPLTFDQVCPDLFSIIP